MGMTLAEKILSLKAGKNSVRPGEIVKIPVDRAMTYDVFGPSVVTAFRDMGFRTVWDADKIVIIFDHLAPAKQPSDTRYLKTMREFAGEQAIHKLHESDGICHQILFEAGYAKPGEIVLGTDSHTCMLGAIGAFATGIGYTEMAAVWGTGSLWLKVPSSLRFELKGRFPRGVFSKDLILKIIGDIGPATATYKSMEFSGGLLEKLSISQRLTICNMAVECGAKTGLIAADGAVREFFEQQGHGAEHALQADPDAVYDHVYEYDVSRLEPQVSCSPSVENVMPLSAVKGESISKAFLGSCTNGRLDDLEIAASIVKGRRISRSVEFIVTPASRSVYLEAAQKGILSTLAEAGATITHPACGLCSGMSGGIVAEGDTLISTNNRNYLGRMGGLTSKVLLASPASIAVAAVEGKVGDPREYL